MTGGSTVAVNRSSLWQRFGHVGMALGLTLLLLVFLVFARWLDTQRVPDQVVRMMEAMPPVALPAPPPPPTDDAEPQPDNLPPPPPAKVELPQLELQIEAVAPPLAAKLDARMEMSMQDAVFDVEVDPPPPAPRPVAAPAPRLATRTTSSTTAMRAPQPTPTPAPAVRSSYDAGELDSKPRLVNRPSATYPRVQSRAGVKEGKVLLEVAISTSGSVSVRRVIASSHPDFTAMAKQFASRAKFSVPKKNGRPVTAIYRWPLILRP